MSEQALLEKPASELMLPVGETKKLLEASDEDGDLSASDERWLLLGRIELWNEELEDPAKSDKAKEKLREKIDEATEKLDDTQNQILGNVAIKFE